MFNIVNHFVYEFRGTPAMASDIATVGTALEVADGYKIQFNFYTTVALVMLFDFIMLGRVIKCEPVFKKVSHRLCGIRPIMAWEKGEVKHLRSCVDFYA